MKILFVSLDVDNHDEYSSNYFPLGLSILAEVTKSMGIHAELFDINLYLKEKRKSKNVLEEIVEEFIEINPDIIGYFTRCDILPRVIKSAEIVKKKMKKVKIFLGGSGVYGNERDILLNFKFIDLIILGEGEKTIRRILSGNLLKEIPGIAFREQGNVVVNRDVELINDLDIIPIPKRRGEIRKTDLFQIEAGRGCPYNCSFCSTSIFWKRKYRVRTPKRLLDEIEDLLKYYGNIKFTFLHDNLAVSQEYVEELVAEIKKRELHFSWGCCARIDNINERIIQLLKSAGCTHIYFGIETGSERMQKIIGKNIHLNTIYENMELCNKYGIDTTQSYVLGFPEESIEDIDLTLELAIKLANYTSSKMVQLSYLQPTPGTKVTIENFDKLFLDNSQILLLLKRNEEFIPGLELDLSLIKKYPSIFSSFYKIQLEHSFDLYKCIFCFSHLLVYYKKTLSIVCDKYGIKPLEFYSYIEKNCRDYKCHLSAIDATMGGKGICRFMGEAIEQIIPNITTVEKYIVNFEMEKRNCSIKMEYKK